MNRPAIFINIIVTHKCNSFYILSRKSTQVFILLHYLKHKIHIAYG